MFKVNFERQRRRIALTWGLTRESHFVANFSGLIMLNSTKR